MAQGLRPPTVDEAIASIGWGAPALVVKALGPDQNDAVDRVQQAFREDYRRNIVVDTEVYEGMETLLHDLRGRGVTLAVATNKPGALTRLLLRELGLAPLFDHVLAPEDVLRPKPAPDMLRLLLDRCHIGPEEAVMVGDMETDVDSARAASVRAVLVTYSGFVRPEGLAETADDVATTVDELRDLLL